jgi:putative Ca2+/H+ antiporter (TMEM165/GDT1 family)
MEAIVPAFLLAVLTQLGDRPPLLTAVLADRYGRPLLVALAAGLAHGIGNAVAAALGASMAPILNSHAQALLLAVALVLGGIGGLFPMRLGRRLEDWRLGPFLTPLIAVAALAIGERTQFFTLALATRGQPALAAAGAIAGSFAVALVAAVLGELGWNALRLHRLRIAVAILFLVAGIYIGLGAVRLL